MNQKAVIDRFEGGQAAFLMGEGERQSVVERSALPPGCEVSRSTRPGWTVTTRSW
jgi:hypothetical protein